MRLISRGAFVALAVVLLAGVVGSASASAAECPGTGSGVALCSGGHVQEGTFAFTGKQNRSYTLEPEGLGKWTCESGGGSKGQFVATKGKVEITGLVIRTADCHLAGTTCTVKPVIFDGGNPTGSGPGLGGVLPNAGAVTLSSPAKGEPFTELITTNCVQAGTLKIKGKQVCSLPSSTVEASTHQLTCDASGSKLATGSRSVFVTLGETIELSPGKVFSLQQS
ncbi:MAG TPA: hypothetical protein VGG98_07835 [Solirubrobacteraceae bacterium]|jgi:hypothetical protein